MKRILALLGILCILTSGCAAPRERAQIVATTLPVYEFTTLLCQGTPLGVTWLVTENVSCLHDYSLQVDQMRAVEAAELVVLSGAGLEDFLTDVIGDKSCIDSSKGITLLAGGHDHDHGHEHEHSHDHEADAHIWLSPANAAIMAENICAGLTARYPQYADIFAANLEALRQRIMQVQADGEAQLADLSCRELITFHDGFSYFAEAFSLTVLEAVEEESGSEASAAELKHLITLAREHNLPAVFTERSGSVSAAAVLTAELKIKSYELDMAMAGDSWFDAMYHNIHVIKEALG